MNVMKRNMGNVDRILRVVFAALVIVFYVAGIIDGTLAIVLSVLGGVFLLTSFVGYCPIYAVVGLNTCPAKTAE